MLLTRLSADVVAALYCAAISCGMAWPALRRQRMRPLWTAGVMALVIHVLIAYGRVYDWSHAAAVTETVERTRAATGWTIPGGGIHANFVCLAIWLADVAWWWLAPDRYETRSGRALARRFGYIVQAVVAFLMFNAAVVFARGPAQWVFAIATAGLLGQAFFYRSRDRGAGGTRTVTK